MKYVTLADMSRAIRDNFWKVPHDIDFVVGIPRSGMIAASIISEFLDTPLIDLESFVFGATPSGGNRLRRHGDSGRERPRVLVVDDTIFHGRATGAARQKLARFTDRYEFVYLVVYLEGPCNAVDVWLEDVRGFTENYTAFVLYEWNIIHHLTRFMEVCIYDIDGVMCKEPPDERTGEPYLDYIKQAVPLFTPSVPIGEIVSYRLASNEKVTREWLSAHGIRYNTLTMFPASSWQERADSGISPAEFKARIYGQRSWARLFVESSDAQSSAIFTATGKPVYCVESNKLYAR